MANAQRLHVLVVDRDEGSVAEIKNLLSEDGYQVEAVTEPSHSRANHQTRPAFRRDPCLEPG